MAEKRRTPAVLWITPWYPSRVHSTLGNFVERHARVAAEVADVYIIHFQKNNKKHSEVVSLSTYGLRGHHLFYGSSVSGKLKMMAHLVNQLLRRSQTTDVIHLTIFKETFLIALIARLMCRKPILCTEHWTGYHNGDYEKLPNWKKWCMKLACRYVDEFTPVTEHLGRCMQQAFGREIAFSVLPNVVNINVFRPSDTVSKKFDFIHISTLDFRHKRPDVILRQFEKVLSAHPVATLCIGGDGDSRELRRLAKNLKISHAVTFFGELTSDEVAAYLSQSRALVLYSRFENFPCVIAEAFACGIPVISSDVGGIREWLTDEYGTLVDPHREDELSQAMIKMLNSPEKYRQRALTAHAAKNFGHDAVKNKLKLLYSKRMPS